MTGEALIAALQASPDRDIDIAPARQPFAVRNSVRLSDDRRRLQSIGDHQ